MLREEERRVSGDERSLLSSGLLEIDLPFAGTRTPPPSSSIQPIGQKVKSHLMFHPVKLIFNPRAAKLVPK